MLIEIIEFVETNDELCSCSSSLSSSDDESEPEQLKDNLFLHLPTTAPNTDDGGGRLATENIQRIDYLIPADHVDCTSTSSNSKIGNGELISTLATVVEDQELSINADDVSRTIEGQPYLPMRLTKESLRATQRRRLTVRRPRTHGYSVYNDSISTPTINSVSGQYSVRSAVLRKSAVATPVRSSCIDEFMSKLIPKLEDVRRKQTVTVDQLNRIEADGTSVIPTTPSHNQSDSQFHVLTNMMSKRLHLDDDNDQSILDQHVSRVWSNEQMPMVTGTMSSKLTADSRQPILRSKSMNVYTPITKLKNKWPSDCGISGRSMTTMRSRDKFHRRSIDSSITVIPMEDARPHLETVAFYTFSDEDLPYRLKLHSLQPTLRQFKEKLPRKGNFRFFFKTSCEDLEDPIVRQEIINDDEILPLFEGRVKAFVKPCE